MKKLLLCLCIFLSMQTSAQSFLDLNAQFIQLYKKNAFKEALPFGLKAIQQAKIEYGDKNITYAVAVHNVAETYYKLKQYNNALPYYHESAKAYAVYVRTTEYQAVALCNNSIGEIYLIQKSYDSSAYYLEKAFAFFISEHEEQYNNAIGVMNNLVDLYFPLKEFIAAEKVFTKILPIIEKKEGMFSANYRVTFDNILFALNESKQYIEMRFWLKKMLPAIVIKYGNKSKEYGDITYQFGNCYNNLTNLDSAIFYYKEAYKAYIISNFIKPTNDLAIAANNIGLAYLELKKTDSAAKYLEIAFDFFVKNSASEYDNAIQLMKNLQNLYLPIERFNEMNLVYNKVLPIVEKKEGIYSENYFTIFSGISKISKSKEALVQLENQLKNILLQFEKSNKINNNEWYPEYLYLLAKCYRNQEKYATAIEVYNQTITVFTSFFKDAKNKSVTICYNDLGIIYLEQKKYDLATSFFEKSFSYFKENKITEYENLIIVADNLNLVYKSSNRYMQIRKLCEEMLSIIKIEETEYSKNYCTNLFDLCSALRFLYNYKILENRVQELVKCVRKVYVETSIQYAEALDYSGLCQIELNNFEEAEKLLNQSVTLKKSLGKDANISLVLTYMALANLKSAAGDYTAAYQYYSTAAKILEKEKLTDTQDYLAVLQSWGFAYIDGGLYAEAKEMLTKVLVEQSKFEGENFSGNASILVSIANAEFQLNEMSSAEIHANKAISIANKNTDLKDVIATAKGVLALVNHKLGNSVKGVQLMQESVLLNEQIFGKESTRVALTNTSFSIIYFEMGRYADAELVLNKAIAIQQKIYGKNHPEYALSLMNLAMVYSMQGGNEKAIELLKESMNIYMGKNMAGTSNFIKLLSNLTFIINKLGAYEEAKKLHLQTLDILNSRNENISYNRYIVLNNLSVTCLSLNEYKEAEKYALEAQLIVEKTQGKQSIEYIKTINNLVLIYRKLNMFSTAKKLTDDLLPLAIEVLGKDAELLSTIYFNEAVFASAENNVVQSANYLNKATNIIINNFKQNFYTLSEKEKLAWWQEKDYLFAFYPSLLTRFPAYAPSLIEAYTNQQLQLKGFVLNDASAALRKARTSGNKTLIQLIDQWQSTRTLLSKQLTLPIKERYYKVDSLEAIANVFEKNINQQSSGVLTIQTQLQTYQKIQAVLKNNEVAIEYIRFPFYKDANFTDTFKYAAMIIGKTGIPKFIELANEQQINWCLTGGKTVAKETRVNNLYRSTIKKQSTNATFAGDSLYNLVWKPLLPHLNNINSIAYAPDGLLHKVAFQALPMIAKEKYLIDEYALHQYSSIRQLTEVNYQQYKFSSAYLMGNTDFNTLSSTVTSTGANISFSSNATNQSWAALPGTEKEIVAIEKIFTSKNIQVTTATAAKATEEKFKSISNQSSSIIHLATHGFFLPDPTTLKNNSTENSFAIADDPLMRSGIIMAGANKAWSGEKIPLGVEDGILTAYEIAQLNLSNTQLVVLSACETALGDLQGTEGVFGLQRAFKIAGVKNMIVSLWQVPDKETAELMTTFYNHLLSSNISVRDAFTRAQKEMRVKYPPFSWAAFVLIE